MFYNGFSWVICMVLAVVVSTVCSDIYSTTESPKTEAIQEAEATTAVDLSALQDAGAGAVVTLLAGDTRLPAHSSPAAAGNGTTPGAQQHSGRAWTPVASPSSTSSDTTATPDDISGSLLRNISVGEKGKRLLLAAKQGDVGEIERLLVAGADVQAKDWSRRTALYWATAMGHVEAARTLIARGADVNARDSKQETPLHEAAFRDHATVVRLLTASYADPNVSNVDRRTPLHYAAYLGHTEVAAALLEAGADRGVADRWGDTPLDDARHNNHQQIIDMLTQSEDSYKQLCNKTQTASP